MMEKQKLMKNYFKPLSREEQEMTTLRMQQESRILREATTESILPLQLAYPFSEDRSSSRLLVPIIDLAAVENAEVIDLLDGDDDGDESELIMMKVGASTSSVDQMVEKRAWSRRPDNWQEITLDFMVNKKVRNCMSIIEIIGESRQGQVYHEHRKRLVAIPLLAFWIQNITSKRTARFLV